MTPFHEQMFIDELSATGNIEFACLAGRCTRREAFDHRLRSPGFERRWRQAAGNAKAAFDGRLQTAVFGSR